MSYKFKEDNGALVWGHYRLPILEMKVDAELVKKVENIGRLLLQYRHESTWLHSRGLPFKSPTLLDCEAALRLAGARRAHTVPLIIPSSRFPYYLRQAFLKLSNHEGDNLPVVDGPPFMREQQERYTREYYEEVAAGVAAASWVSLNGKDSFVSWCIAGQDTMYGRTEETTGYTLDYQRGSYQQVDYIHMLLIANYQYQKEHPVE